MKYIKLNIIPILIGIMLFVLWFIVPIENYIYVNFLCYLFLFIYYFVKGDISIGSWLSNLKSGKKFWKQVIVTFLFLGLVYLLTFFLENKFDAGFTKLMVNNWVELMIFFLSTVMLPAVVDEIFFRKSLISFDNKYCLFFSTLFSMLLFGITHAVKLWGIFLVMLWAIPLSLSYIKTKNIYVPMTAHFLGSLLNIISIVNFIMYFA